MKRAVTLCAVAVALYLTVYIVYRARHVQVWAGDGKAYVILGSRLSINVNRVYVRSGIAVMLAFVGVKLLW